MHHILCNFVKDMANKTYLMMDDLGFIDIESMYMTQMKRVHRKMGDIAESVPFVAGAVKRPATDVMETDDAIIVAVEIPGATKEDIDISVIGDELSIRAKRSEEVEEPDISVHKCERSYDVFKRQIRLPTEVKAEESKAALCNGVLKITLPKVTIISKTKIGVEEVCT
ncbi:MAG: Hsp20/alpha crystallin family protein [Methanotrichaceae archaeon]|nr:Hsp20/alpha crystallin family protein [Methanotrichaceae archaeon]